MELRDATTTLTITGINRLSSRIFNETFYECKLNPIQISCFVEQRARLAILKNAIPIRAYFRSASEGADESGFLPMIEPGQRQTSRQTDHRRNPPWL